MYGLPSDNPVGNIIEIPPGIHSSILPKMFSAMPGRVSRKIPGGIFESIAAGISGVIPG